MTKKKTSKGEKKMRISTDIAVDKDLLYQELKDSFLLAPKKAPTIEAPKVKMAPKLPKSTTSQCSFCGWYSGGSYGPNQHAWNCKNEPHNIKKALEIEATSISGPFTAQSVFELCKRIDANELAPPGAIDGYSYESHLHQKYLNNFNRAFQKGGFESPKEWWESGFNVVWGCPASDPWEKHQESDKCFQILYTGFQRFILENQPPKPIGVKTTRKTQKARGIEKLTTFAWKQDGVSVLPHLFVSNAQVKQIANATFPEKDAKELWLAASGIGQGRKGERLVFARCCPLTPRHGFTDSVFVSVGMEFPAALGELCHKMLVDDPEAELILMQPCFAHFNIVTNEKAIVVGAGHDGATGGKDTFTFPVSKPFQFSPSEKEQIGIASEGGVFREYVGRMQKGKRRAGYEHAGAGAQGGFKITQTFLTQLRGGPKIDVTGDFVPREICLDRDYLIPHKNPETGEEYKDTEWEKVISDVKARDDWEKYFVCHPGGAISSHFGVHCYINQIPYITSGVRLSKRTILKPNAIARSADPEAFIRGFRKGPNLLPLITPAKGVEILLAALHNYPAMDASDPKQAEFLGFAVEFAIHLGLATCLGESRYAKRVRMDLFKTQSNNISREFVYHRAQMFDLNYVLRKAHHRCPWFGVPEWGGSVGGLKWLECSEAVFELWNATCELVQKGSNESLGQMISQLNKVVNICHNAAKMLTKFTRNPAFDFAANKPNEAAFRIAPILFELLKADVAERPIWFEKFKLPREKWDAIRIRGERAKRDAEALKKWELEVAKKPKFPCAPIDPRDGYDQCQVCGWYTDKGAAKLGHYHNCPAIEIAPHDKLCSHYKKAASSEPPSYETPDSDSKCGDTSCSNCYPQQAGKE